MSSGAPRWNWWVAAAAAVSVGLRLRFLTTPISVDEAGALVVARSWAAGQHLYAEVFIDRPQGLLVLIRGWDAVFGPDLWAIRVLALVAGIVVVVAAATAARAVAGRPAAAAVAAWMVAVISASAAFEGHTANGELLAGAFTVPAMALGALVVTRRVGAHWLVAVGVLAVLGITVKQSAFDVAVAVGLWLVVAAWQRWRPRREVAAMAGWFALGAGSTLIAVGVHGATFGWDDYAYALYGFRIHARSAVAGPQGGRFGVTLLIALPLLGPAVALAGAHLRTLERPLRSHARPEHFLVLLWSTVALAGFIAGGNYHRHYWIQLTFPICILAAVALTTGPPTEPRALARTTAAALALPLLISLALIARPTLERDPRVAADAAIARWYEEQRSGPNQALLPLCASVTWYLEAGQPAQTPYLWVDHVRDGRNGVAGLVRLLDGPDRPAYLAMHQPAQRCDPTGGLQRAIDRHYRPAATVAGVEILVADSGG